MGNVSRKKSSKRTRKALGPGPNVGKRKAKGPGPLKRKHKKRR